MAMKVDKTRKLVVIVASRDEVARRRDRKLVQARVEEELGLSGERLKLGLDELCALPLCQ